MTQTKNTPVPDKAQEADVFADTVFAAVKGFVGTEFTRQFEAAVAPLLKRLEELTPGLDGAPGKDGADGKDGEAGPAGPQGDDGVPGIPGETGRDGRDGKNGTSGRDAAHIEVLTGIDENKSYVRGTFATHKGGLWRAADTTDGMDGWVCVTRGVDVETEETEDSGRMIRRRTVYSDGQVFERTIKTSAMVYRGIFVEGRAHEPGDTTTWGGSLWHCDESTLDKPGEGSKAWRLAAKRGRDGRDGVTK